MKPFLGIDLTTDKKNEQFNGTEFLVMQPSSAMAQSFEQSSKKAEETIERSKLPLPLRITQLICGGLGAISAVGIIRGLGTVSLNQAYKNAPWVFWLGGVCLSIWGILKIINTLKEKAVLGTEESSHTLTNLEKTCAAVYSEMSVPTDAKEVDILSFLYKEKNSQLKICEKGMQLAPYLNPVFKIFSDANYLYIANLEGKYAFPLSSLVSIHTVKKRIRIAGWNKEIGFKQGVYKQYKLERNNIGNIFCKNYYILEVYHNGVSYGIYVPCYELPIFEELTGLKAEKK